MDNYIKKIRENIKALSEELTGKRATFIHPGDIKAWMNDELEDEDMSVIHEAPQVSCIGRHGEYLTYAAADITNGVVTAYGKDDSNFRLKEEFMLNELRMDEIIDLATSIDL